MRTLIVASFLVATAMASPNFLRFRRDDEQGTCTGTCINIKKNPQCSGYIYLGRCGGNGLGCCLDGGPPRPPPPSNPNPPPSNPNPPPPGKQADEGSKDNPAGRTCGPQNIGVCVNIKEKPVCAGYIHLEKCPGTYGCCI